MASFKVSSFLNENRAEGDAGRAVGASGLVAAKVGGMVQGTRRAFGDIGNVVGAGLTVRETGKENAAGSSIDCGGLQAHNAALLAAGANASSVWGTHRPRSTTLRTTTNGAPAPGVLTRAAAKSMLDGARSMSGLLQSCSESVRRGERPEEHALPDIDAADKENPLACTEYVNDIYSYFRRVEPELQPPHAYMASQTDINDKMRAILVDWLVEVHLKFKLMPETLYLTVNLIDRFLSKKPVTRKNLQLVGVTAMLVASKYEEIWAPEVRDFVYISDKAYTRDQILGMEKLMLNTLSFKLTLPTPYVFLTRYLKAAGADKRTEMLANFMVELALPEYPLLKHAGSLLAAGAVYAAQRTLAGPTPWSMPLQRHSGYGEGEVRAIAATLASLHRKAATASLLAVHKKYLGTRFLEIARQAADGPLADEGDAAAAAARAVPA